MRTTIELSNEHRAQLLALAAERGENRFSALVADTDVLIDYLAGQEPAADRAADTARALDAEGLRIGMADAPISGIVVSSGDVLLTRNRQQFDRVDGLRLSALAGTDEG